MAAVDSVLVRMTITEAKNLPKMKRYEFGDLSRRALGRLTGSISPSIRIFVTAPQLVRPIFEAQSPALEEFNNSPIFNFTFEFPVPIGSCPSISIRFELWDLSSERKGGECSLIDFNLKSTVKLYSLTFQLEPDLIPDKKAKESTLFLRLDTIEAR